MQYASQQNDWLIHPFPQPASVEISHDSDDRERKGLTHRKMYRTVAPQVTENPILMHVRSADPKRSVWRSISVQKSDLKW